MTRDYIAPTHDEDVWAGNFKKPQRVIFSMINFLKTDGRIDFWKGQGYYRIAYSDGGQPYTSNGPVWYDSYMQLSMALEDAWKTATPTHIPYSEYLGPVLFFEWEE